jgi:bifunctional non-homologous end joining protein LigD
MLSAITPLPLIKQPDPFTDPDWLFEVKYDGFRSLAFIGDGTCRLVSRNGNTFKRFRSLSKALSKLSNETVLDGEIACVDNDGLPQFDDLMFAQRPALFSAFDILALDGEDLRDKPCIEQYDGI